MELKKSSFKLTKDEQGKLQGGFSLQGKSDSLLDSRTNFFADNHNCKSGGFFDTNTNCNRCAECDHHAPSKRQPSGGGDWQ